MNGTETILLPAWVLIGGAGLGLLLGALLTAQLLFARRQALRLDALTAALDGGGGAEAQAGPNLQKRLDEALAGLRQASEQALRADQANEAKSAFLARMSHELRTPLSAIIGFAEMIEQQSMGPIGNLKYSGYATDIRQSGQHLLGIINDILDLSKVESGRETLHESVIEPAALISNVEVLLNGRPQDAGVALRFDCPEGLPAVKADKRRLTQILVNLLANAIKFTPEGGTVMLRCWATEGSGFVFQAVDNGVGIAREDIPQALAVFGQVGKLPEQEAKGTGLGLPLAKALAELHGGTLDLQSELGKGTTVTLRLPAHRIVARRGAEGAAA
ncbi:ATP-binding protein [Pelagibius sp. CAU 1746]|uniref:sensor histidine kinase n=1 Tax=Pelagibius sp. CAU 1746 TaxID=3140370 RepID=UPI00325B9410